jgi:hypothetical protein
LSVGPLVVVAGLLAREVQRRAKVVVEVVVELT